MTQFTELINGDAKYALDEFYTRRLSEVPKAQWSRMMHGMGYNFEYYDYMFSIMSSHVQGALDSDYTVRYNTMQHLLQPYCSEFGIEVARPLGRTHRQLYKEFYELVNGHKMPERYPSGANEWLSISKKWADCMLHRLLRPNSTPTERAKYNVAYHWAVEYLSQLEFELMRDGWKAQGVNAAYLDAHCAVETEHSNHATAALLTCAKAHEAIVKEAVQDHEEDLAGYYREISTYSKFCAVN